MPIIKPISDLRNYSAVLQDVAVGTPVYLTKNGRYLEGVRKEKHMKFKNAGKYNGDLVQTRR